MKLIKRSIRQEESITSMVAALEECLPDLSKEGREELDLFCSTVKSEINAIAEANYVKPPPLGDKSLYELLCIGLKNGWVGKNARLKGNPK